MFYENGQFQGGNSDYTSCVVDYFPIPACCVILFLTYADKSITIYIWIRFWVLGHWGHFCSVQLFTPTYSVGVASWSWRNFISPRCVCVYKQDNKNISDRVTAFHQNTPTFLFLVFISRNFSLAHCLWFELWPYSLRCSHLPPLVSPFLPGLTEHSRHRWPKRNKLTLSPRFTTEHLAPTEQNASTIIILFKSWDLNLAEWRELSHRQEINTARWGGR